MPTLRRRSRGRRPIAATALAVALAVGATGCGKPAGNDTPKLPGEQNPARNGPPYEH